jgi:hypothetical protein
VKDIEKDCIDKLSLDFALICKCYYSAFEIHNGFSIDSKTKIKIIRAAIKKALEELDELASFFK